MLAVKFLILALFCISSVLSRKGICDFNDSKCQTAGAVRTYEELIFGKPGVEPSDPLHVDVVEANLPTIKYKLTNVTLTGMKDCHVELVKISVKDKTYNYHIGCPHLSFESLCELKGKIGPEMVDIMGSCNIESYDYKLLFNGNYERKYDRQGKLHIHLTTHNLELEAKGKVQYTFENHFRGNKAKTEALHKFANENWQYVDKVTRQPAMEACMNKYIHNVNDYLEVTPVEDLFIDEKPDKTLKDY